MDINTIIIFLGCIIAFLVLGKILLFPFKKVLKLIFNSVIGRNFNICYKFNWSNF